MTVMIIPAGVATVGGATDPGFCGKSPNNPLCTKLPDEKNTISNPIIEACHTNPRSSACGVVSGLEDVRLKVPDLINENISIVELVLTWINWALGFLVLIAVIILIYAGVLYISPNTDKKEKANKLIVNPIIGIVIIFLSYTIVNFIFSFFIQQ